MNLISGTGWPDGDPFLQRQNEPSLAASTRNPLHLLGGSNDYRSVDIPGLPAGENGDAWLGVFKSFDGGITWKSTLLPGYPQDKSADGKNSPLYGLNAAADSTVRSGTNGLFYFSGMAFDRNTSSGGKVFVARFIDNNNKEKGDTIQYLGAVAVDVGTSGQFLDKPALVVDIPRGSATCTVPGQAAPIPAGPVYVVWSVFIGNQLPAGQVKKDTDPGGRSSILIAKSSDCGATFGKPQKISERSKLNQGSVAAIDPNTGAVYVAWREFAENGSPDAILVSKSTDFGGTFTPAVTVANISPFDQGSSANTFRTNSLPTMAVDAGTVQPDGTSTGPGRVHVAWAQNGAGFNGDARIVVASSIDGKTWTSPIVADTSRLIDPKHPFPQGTTTQWRGHQVMPALTFAGGRLQLVYYDFRNDASGIFTSYDPARHVGVSEADVYAWNATHPSNQKVLRHTVDVFAVQATPGMPPQFGPSVAVSRYLEGQKHKGDPVSQLQFNPVNLPLFAGGTTPFMGDYLDVAATPSFILDPSGQWRYNTRPSDSQTYVAVWADNRDVRGPPPGKTWKDYTAPTFANSSLFSQYDPTQQLQACSAGTAGMRNQNIYSARISSGLTLTVLGNNKPLGLVPGTQKLMQRTFVVTVGNPDLTNRNVILHIGAQPPGGMASFAQFKLLVDLPVTIAPKSTISREVFVSSSNKHASVPITVTDANSATIAAAAVLNPDFTNPDFTNPDFTNPDFTNPNVTDAEAHAVAVSNAMVTNPDFTNPDFTNRDITNPDFTNPDFTNPDFTNPDFTNPNVANPDFTNPDFTNPDFTNPDFTNPDFTNPDFTNSSLTDVTWAVKNQGNTATSYQVKLLLADAKKRNLLRSGARLQLVVTKTTTQTTLSPDCKPVEAIQNTLVANIKDPSFVDPSSSQQFATVVNPDIENSAITNATVGLAPGDTAFVTLRVFSPIADGDLGTIPPGSGTGDLSGALEELQSVGVATTSHPVDTLAVAAGSTTPVIQASVPIIVTTTLPDGTRTFAYSGTIETVGGNGSRYVSVATGSLPPGLSLNTNTGIISGTATATGAFTFTARVIDDDGTPSESTLTIRIFEPLNITTSSLTGAVVNQPYSAPLIAVGGFQPYSWALASGAVLPAGVSLSSAGLLSGTPTQSGTFTLTVTANDAAGPFQAASASLTLNVTPVANSQSVTVVEDTATPLTLTAAGGGTYTFAIANQPAHGTLSGSAPALTYTPASNYNGADSFTFRVTQGALTSAVATVSLNVTAVNDAPTANPQSLFAPFNNATGQNTVGITLSASDPENDPLTFSIATGPTHGTLTGTPPLVTYKAAANYTGPDSFTFRANDGQANSAAAAVSITVGTPPAGSADLSVTLTDNPDPVALGGAVTYTATISNASAANAGSSGVTLAVSFPSADLLIQSVTPSQGTCTTGASSISCTVGAIGLNGNATVTITAKAYNHGGTVSLTASASQTNLDYYTGNNTATQTTTISGPATATADLSVLQQAAPTSVNFGSNSVITMTVSNAGPSDATGVVLTSAFTSSAAYVSSTAGQGSCSISGSQLSCNVGSLAKGASAIYTVTLQAVGAGSFTQNATVSGAQSDPNAGDNTSTVIVTVNNRAPTATGDSLSVLEDATATTVAVLANDTDPDGDTLTVTAVGSAAHGIAALNGSTVTYAPASDYFGPDSFTYTISDGHGGTANGTVTVSVLAVNDAPSFVSGGNQNAIRNSGAHSVPGWASSISTGPANESSQTPFFVVFNTNHAIFSVQPSISADGTLTYTVADGASGSSSVTAVLHDDGGTANGGNDTSAPSTFTITVSDNTPPTATNDSVTTISNSSTTSAPASNDTDLDNPAPAIVGSFRLLAPGQFSLANPNTIAFVPSSGLAYVSAGAGMGIVDTASNTVTGMIPGAFAAARLVNTATNYLYVRSSNGLQAIDVGARPTVNTIVMNLQLGALIQSFALDQAHGLLYVINQVSNFAGVSQFESQVAIVDVNPANPTFHTVLTSLVIPGGFVGRGIAVNSATNTAYVATSGGVFTISGATLTMSGTSIANTFSALMPVVNEATNYVYVTANPSINGISTAQVYAIDGATATRTAALTLAGTLSQNIDRRIAIDAATNKVYVVASEFPLPDHVTVINGTPASGNAFNTIIAQPAIGREDGATAIAIDPAAGKVAVPTNVDFATSILSTASDTVVATVPSTQPMLRVEINPGAHTAYVSSNLGFVQVISLASGTLATTIPMGGLLSVPVVNPVTHQAYVTATTLSSTVNVFDPSSQLPAVTGLPNVDGSYAIAAVDATRNRIYVTNQTATVGGGAAALPGFVTVINGATNAVIGNVAAGNFPIIAAVNEAANKIYVGNQFDISNQFLAPGGLTVIDGATLTSAPADISQIPLTSGFAAGQISIGRDVAVNSATGKVYFRVTNGSPNTMAVLNGTTNVATPLSGFGIANIIRINPTLNRVYVGDTVNGQNVLHVLNGTTDAEITALSSLGPKSVLGGTQQYVAVNTTTGQVWITNWQANTVTAVNGNTNAVDATIGVGHGPHTVVVDETTNHVYVGNWFDHSVTIIDGATLRVLTTVTLPMSMGPRCPTSCGQLRLTPNPGTNTFFAALSGEAGSDPVVVIVSDPSNPNGPLTITSAGQGAHGTTTVNADGTVTYTPNANYVGSDSYTYSISDGHGGTASATVNVTVQAALAITTASLPNSTAGASYPSVSLAATGGTGPYVWTVLTLISGQQLPPGLALTSGGLLYGKTLESGTFTFTVQLRDSSVSAPQFVTQVFTITVGPVVITTQSLPNGFVGTPYNQTLTAAGNTGAVTWSFDPSSFTPPPWLSLAANGVLSGTPPVYGTPSPGSFTVRATDSTGFATRSLSIFVDANLDVLTLREAVVLETPPVLPIIGGHGTKVAAMTAGALPPGLLLTSSGSFTGSPTRHGNYNFTVQVTDCTPSSSCGTGTTQQSITKALAMRVSPKDQQGSSLTTSPISFGGPGGRKIAQVITVGAQGTLTAVGLQNLTCPSSLNQVTVEIQRLTPGGLPDNVAIASGTALNANSAFSAIAISPTIDLPIDARFAFVLSAPVACTLTNSSTGDFYQAGDAYTNTGGGGSWVTLFSTDGRYDVPSFRTLIQPAIDVAYQNQSRSFHRAALLDNNTLPKYGSVLVTGNNNTAELYDPASNTFLATANMSVARQEHTATTLPNGTVLIAGGRDSFSNRLATAEIYNPTTGAFSPTSNTLGTAREQHTATLLSNGKVLLTGGITTTGSTISSAELYDPATKTFSSAGSMTTNRNAHAAVLLNSGKVLIVGGFGNSSGRSAELYDPALGTFTTTTGQMITQFRGRLTATKLADGKVLITGGQSGDVQNTAEIFDPAAGTFAATATMGSKRYLHSATLLPDGSVLMAGGFDQPSSQSYVLPLASMERFIPGATPAAGMFVPAGSMETRREAHTATALLDGRVFFSGGSSQSWMSGNTGELYDQAAALSFSPTTLPDGHVGSAYSSTTLTPTGGTGPYQIQQISGTLPPGISYTQATQTFAGNPTTAGTFTVGMRVTDSASHVNVQSLTIRVDALVITTAFQLPNAAQNRPYNFALSSTGGTAPVSWSVMPASNQLPSGLSLTTAGVITGTPTTLTGVTFEVRAVDFNGLTALKTLSLSVQSPLSITTTSLREAVLFQTYSPCISTSNGNGTRTFSISNGAPPVGATLQSNGCFTGNPMATGNSSFTVQVTDQTTPPQTASQAYTVHASAPDQSRGGDGTNSSISFGTSSGRSFAQSVVAGASGALYGIDFQGQISCSQNGFTTPQITVQVQGASPTSLAPDGIVFNSGAAVGTGNYFDPITFPSPVNFDKGERFTLVLTTSNSSDCQLLNAPVADGYLPGSGFEKVGAGAWTRLEDTQGKADLQFKTLIVPSAVLSYFNGFRSTHSATVLTSGKILLAGSDGTADLYNPSNGSVTALSNMIAQRGDAAVVRLDCPSSNLGCSWNGTVLIAGGRTNNGTTLSSAEVFDASGNSGAGTFTAVPVGMSTPRQQATATLLASGKVLIAGGQNNGQPAQTAELYDPAAGTFTVIPNLMVGSRSKHTATLLTCPASNPTCTWNGKVLLAGGFSNGPFPVPNGEIYDPVAETFTATAGPIVALRTQHTATLISDGRVVLIGGTRGSGIMASAAEFYDPSANSFTSTGSLTTDRAKHAVALLGDGSILVAGGIAAPDLGPNLDGIAEIERFLPASGTFVPAGSMAVNRYDLTASLIAGGKVFLAGGSSSSLLSPRSGEVYDPATVLSFSPVTLPDGQLSPPTAYNASVTATGGTGSITIALASGALPPGVSFNASPGTGTATLSGTPTAAGTYSFALRATDGASHSATQSYTIRVSAMSITTNLPPDAHTGVAYSQSLAAANGTVPINWTIVANSNSFNLLPPGLTLSAGGTISGTPTTLGFYTFTVRARDAANQTAFRNYYINVTSPLAITTASLNDGVAGSTYGGCINYANGSGTVAFTLSGSYPPGLAFKGSCFDGSNFPAHILRQSGSFAFTVTATDSSNPVQTATHNYTINVHAPDQQLTTSPSASIALTSSRRLAQVFTSSTPYNLSGVQLFNVSSCSANMSITAEVRPLTNTSPARPDENGAPLGTATVTTNSTGFFSNPLTFNPPIPVPQHGRFAVVVSFAGSGSCQGTNWPTNDFYLNGDGYVNDGSGWTDAFTVVGRYDIPISTVVLPATSPLFTADYRGGSAMETLSPVTGKLLIVGSSSTAEVYDPAAGTLTRTLGDMSSPRYQPTATLLGNGKVLVVGGAVFSNGPAVSLATTEIFDPAKQTFTAGPTLPVGRYHHRATRLDNGNVLVTGGVAFDSNGFGQTLQSAYLFSADGMTILATLNMTGARQSHTSTLLPGGTNRVLITGGWTGTPQPSSAEIYDIAGGPNGSFTATSGNMNVWRSEHSAVALTTGTHSGQILIVGGTGAYPNLATSNEYFDPSTQTFSLAPGLIVPRHHHSVTILNDGRVVTSGGSTDWTTSAFVTSSVEVFDPSANSGAGQNFLVGDLTTDRQDHKTAEILAGPNQGKLFVVGGNSTSGLAPTSAEVFNPVTSGGSVALVITTTSMPDGSVGPAYLAGLNASGGTGSGQAFSVVSGALPPGLSLSSTAIQGNPTTPGSWSFVVKVIDSGSNSATRAFTIVINRLSITAASLPNGQVGSSYGPITLTAGGGSGGVSWNLFGSNFPPGLTLHSTTGVIDGTATQAGGFGFNVEARDASGQVAIRNFFINVVGLTMQPLGTPVLVTPPADPIVVTVDVTGAAGGVSFGLESGQLPLGTVLSNYTSTSAIISGIPTRTGSFPVTIGATDTYGQHVSQNVTVRVVAIDQHVPSYSSGSSYTVNGGHTAAQTLTSWVNTALVGVRSTALSCSPGGSLTVSVRGVDALSGYPNGTTLASQSFAQPIAAGARLMFTNPAFLVNGQKYAIEFASNGTCTFDVLASSDAYFEGAAFENTGSGWHAMPSVGDLTLDSLIDMPDVQFTPTPHWAGVQINPGVTGKFVITGNSTPYELFDTSTRELTTDSNATGPGLPLFYATATALGNGKILIAGGVPQCCGGGVTDQARILDPLTHTYTIAGQNGGGHMLHGREHHSATLLADGRVLIAGGDPGTAAYVQEAEIYDPASDKFDSAGNMISTRVDHQATLMSNGDILITGGGTSTSYVSAEIFRPAIGFIPTPGAMAVPRLAHTATALGDGRVLVVGGQRYDDLTLTPTMEVYDPACACFTQLPSLHVARARHTATTLSDGTVLVAGGNDNPADALPTSSLELVDPGHGFTVRLAGKLKTGRANHAAINACPSASCAPKIDVIFVGGNSGGPDQTSLETWWAGDDLLAQASTGHAYSATVSGGSSPTFALVNGAMPAGLSFNSLSGQISGTPTAPGASNFTVRVADDTGTHYRNFTLDVLGIPPAMSVARYYHSETTLQDGRVVVAGGTDGSTVYDSVYIYDPATNAWSSGGTLMTARYNHSATLLPNGNILVVGGWNGVNSPLNTAEIFTPGTGLWSFATSMSYSRVMHTATLLSDGRVLVAGGSGSGPGGSADDKAEIYTPSSNLWAAATSLHSGRFGHGAALLPDGHVIVAGGSSGGSQTTSAEIYDPTAGAGGAWSPTATSLSVARAFMQMRPLNNGTVIAIGGNVVGGAATTAVDIYSQATGTWSSTVPLTAPRYEAASATLFDGRILVAGGYGASTFPANVEIFDPATRTWSFGGNLALGRQVPSAARMNDGRVLITGGTGASGATSAAQAITPTVRAGVLGPAGGPGGATPYSSSCSPSAYATGFVVDNTNSYALTAAQLRCSDNVSSPKFGGAPTPNFAVGCNPGDRMVGFFGTTDGGVNFPPNPVVSSVGAVCLPSGGGSTYQVGPAPGSGPPFGPFTCPSGQVVVSAQGSTGAVVDNIKLVCGVRP